MRITDLRFLVATAPDELVESASVLHSSEPVVLEPESGLDDATTRAAQVLPRLPAPTVLVGDPAEHGQLAEAVDVCVTSVSDPPRPWVGASAEDVVEAVRRQPLATLSLVVLLRDTQNLGAWQAVAEESATYAMLLGSASFRQWLDQRGPGHHRTTPRPVRTERVGDVLRITLDRPEVRNAIDSATRDALVEGLRLAMSDSRLRVELRGEGPSFSSGGDLEEFGTVRDPALAHAVRLTRHPGLALHAVSSRTTCYLHGQCVGAGVELPAFSARVLADPDTSFRLPEVSMGLVPGAGGTVSITRRIGRQRTAWLALSGATIDCATALGWGLVDGVG